MRNFPIILILILVTSSFSFGQGVEVTPEDSLALAKAESSYWQAMYSLERATRQLQDLLAQVKSRCEQAGGTFDSSQGPSAVRCSPPISEKPVTPSSPPNPPEDQN